MITEMVGGEPYHYYPLGSYVVRAPEVCSGRPTFKYTRIEIIGTFERLALADLNESREHTAAVVLADKIYALGGRWSGAGELTSIEIYDPAMDTWTTGRPMRVARAGFAAAVVTGKIVVAGGEVLSGNNRALTSVEIYDPAMDSWTDGPDLPVGLHGVPAVGIAETVYLLGGSDAAGGIDNAGRVLIGEAHFLSQ